MMLHIFRWLQNNSWIVAMDSSNIGSGFVEVTHYLGLFLLVGATAVVDLRLLGLAGRRLTVTQLASQAFKIMWVGFVINLLSGFIMFAGSAVQYYRNDVFYTKILVVLLGLLTAVIIQWNVPKWDRLPAIPVSAKLLAVVSIALWLGAILAGVEVPALTGVG
jgi:hypothetical protein